MMHRIAKILAGLAILICAVGPAAAAKVGPEFLISNKALNSSVAQPTGGGFVVVWLGDGPLYGIFGQRYSKDAVKIGSQFNVTGGSHAHAEPFVAALKGGGFVVTWDSKDANGLGVWMQRFAANATKLGTRVRVNTFTTDDQFGPTAVGLKNGTFVITWTSNHQGTADSIVAAQRYSGAGAKLGGEVRVDTTFPEAGAFHHFPSIATLANGGYVIAYRGYNGTYARLFTPGGGAPNDDFRVNVINEGLLQHPVVAGLKNGGFVVVRTVSIGSDTDIYAQRFNAAGGKVGGDFKVHAGTADYQSDPAVAGLSNGRFVVAWSESSAHLSKGRLFGANGAPIGGNFTANSTVIPIDARSSVGPLPNGGFVITYQGSALNATFAVRGQRFNGQ